MSVHSFALWLLDIEDGKTGEPYQQDHENTSWIDIPLTYCLPDNEQDLKVGAPLMLLRNVNVASGLCNGTRMIVRQIFLRTFHCMLLDREGNAIHANMNLKDIDFFNPKLQMGSAYRISNFICKPTRPYQQTLENKTSLGFGKYTTFNNISATTFPNHYFQFTSYNQLESKIPRPDENSKMQYLGLIDYIGCIIEVSDLTPFGDPNKTQSNRRKLEIENLNGNIIKLTLWNEMAEHFGQADFEKMDQPVIIATSSCRVSKYRDYQLAASPTMYYYLNPNIPEAQESCALYKFKGHIRDSSGTAPMTFFSLVVDEITKHPWQELMEKYNLADPQKIPPEVLATQGQPMIIAVNSCRVSNRLSASRKPVVQSVENQEQEAKGKEKIAEEQTNKGDTYFIHLSFH
ncbi:nucleic acid-binding, OB-fold protein [Tanacetum coccineum]